MELFATCLYLYMIMDTNEKIIGHKLHVMLNCSVCKPILHKIWLVFSGKSQKNHKDRSLPSLDSSLPIVENVCLSFYPSLHKYTEVGNAMGKYVMLHMSWSLSML